MLENYSGLSNYLTGNALPPEVIVATDIPNLAFMASGPLPPNAADLLASARLHYASVLKKRISSSWGGQVGF